MRGGRSTTSPSATTSAAPPVVGGILSGSVDRARAGFEVIGAHWTGRDTLLVDFSPELRVTWQSSAVGPVRVRFVAKQPAD